MLEQETLNKLMSMDKVGWKELRAAIRQLLSSNEPSLRDDSRLRKVALIPQVH